MLEAEGGRRQLQRHVSFAVFFRKEPMFICNRNHGLGEKKKLLANVESVFCSGSHQGTRYYMNLLAVVLSGAQARETLEREGYSLGTHAGVLEDLGPW